MSLKFAEPVGRAISWWLKSRNYEKFSIKSNYSVIVGRAKIRQNSKFDKASQKCMSSYISAEKPVSKTEKKICQKGEYDLLISTDKCSYRWWDIFTYITFPEFLFHFCMKTLAMNSEKENRMLHKKKGINTREYTHSLASSSRFRQ